MRLPFQKPSKRPVYADYEPLISDMRMRAIAGPLIEKFREHGLPDDTDFVTFIQPPTTIEREGVAIPIPEVAVFAVISNNPRSPKHRVMTQSSVWLADWRATSAAKLHFVSGSADPAYPIFRETVKTHLRVLRNLKEMN